MVMGIAIINSSRVVNRWRDIKLSDDF